MGRKMKDSGIPWLGEIPENWETSILKYSIKWKSEKGAPDETVLSLYRDYGVIPKDSRDDNHNVTSLDTSGYKIVDVGDLVINKMKAWQGSMAVSDYRGIVSPAYHVCTITNPKIYKRYLHHLLRNPAYIPEYLRLSTGMRIGQWDLGFDDFRQIPFILPPLEEQKRIAYYIDNNLGSINSVIEKTQESIEEYKRLKQAVITQAVTKGVRGDRPMKDSGIEWAGTIPNEWELIKLKYMGYAQNGLTYTPADVCDESEGTLVIRSSNVQNGTLDFNDRVYVNSSIPTDLILKIGDIVICSRNGSKKLVGKSAIVEKDITATYGAFMMVFRSNIRNKKYVYWLLNSDLFNYHLNMYSTVTINQLTGSSLNNMVVPFCTNQAEQAEIAAYLDAKCAEIDALIARKEQLLTELENYKKSLIYEYVTGKKEVLHEC